MEIPATMPLAKACILGAFLLLASAALTATHAQTASDDDLRIAQRAATMLQSARTVISSHQERINDPHGSDKGLTGAVILEQTLARYRETSGSDPLQTDPSSYEGQMLRALMDSVVEVIDANQSTINAEGVGFKGLIPATFARLITEAFGRRVGEDAAIKVTAPPDLVRNRQSRPDPWEEAAIRDYLDTADWPRGQIYSGIDDSAGKANMRIMVPEYYVESCMSCHGGPKGEIDLTGYPKEGSQVDDLGGIISIRLVPQ